MPEFFFGGQSFLHFLGLFGIVDWDFRVERGSLRDGLGLRVSWQFFVQERFVYGCFFYCDARPDFSRRSRVTSKLPSGQTLNPKP